ncbi:arsenate reductase-like glutaredoxin family protein [Ammoniphilus resinae]|uniref:Arsenate reductase-like glutaredoxin family protein n=1 Tax=Ammoniphilus resinae TaxID=861532 RepID=A0ABS4GJX5_9BACL|nr:arsenate reductase-like glutaredoxin family protein [Ammoniphilus resinae]
MKDHFSLEELKELIKKTPLEQILNKKGVVYKARREELEGLSEEELLNEMAKEPKLIRRPLIITEDQVIAGYDENKYKDAL